MVDFVLFTVICFGSAVLAIVHLFYTPRILGTTISIGLGFFLGRKVQLSLDPLPMNIRLDGFELFIYNNSGAYDRLKAMLEKEQKQKNEQNHPSPVTVESHPAMARTSKEQLAGGSIAGNHAASIEVKPKDPLPPATASSWEILVSRLFPFTLVGLQGAIVIGNSDISTLMVVDYQDMTGTYTREVLAECIQNIRPELCRYELKLRLGKGRVSFRKNMDYRDPSLNQAARLRISRMQQEKVKRRGKFWNSGGTATNNSLDGGGLVPQDEEAGVEWIGWFGGRSVEEYGKIEEAIITESLEVVYYLEDPGIVGVDTDLPDPKWGVDLILIKSTVNYGPWTNRQRLLIQNYFFPPSYRSYPPTEAPEKGYHRLYPKFALEFKFQEGCSFKVPFREESKDAQFVEDSVNMETRRLQLSLRNPGWLEFAFKGTGSFLKFDIPMTSPAAGYSTVISMKMENLVLSTSLNYAELLRAEAVELDCFLKSPLKWNGERIWNYNVHIENGKLHYLMDHMTLIQDLTSDLSYSPSPPNPAYFVPIAYQIKVGLHNLEIMLCSNRNNIIHIANDIEENSFIRLKVERGELGIEMPYLLARPVINGISFSFQAQTGEVAVLYPQSHGIGAFMTEAAKDVGRFQSLKVSGSYEYYDVYVETPDGPDAITIEVELDTAALKSYGFVVTSLLDVLSNYLGQFRHSISIEDYRLKLSDPLKFKAQRAKMQHDTHHTNTMEISVDIVAIESFIILPENLFDCDYASILHIDRIALDMASNNSEQILKVVTSPIAWTRAKTEAIFSIENIRQIFDVALAEPKNCLNIGGLEVLNRQLFGPSPKFKVYASETRVHCHPILGEILPQFMHGVFSSLSFIGHHLSGVDDGLPTKSDPTIDVVKVRVGSIKVSLWGIDSVTFLELERGIKIQYDSLITSKWTNRTLLDIPCVNLKVLTATEEHAQRWQDQEWIEVFSFDTSVSVCFFSFSADAEVRRAAQRSFVISQDKLQRCLQLFHPNNGVVTDENAFKVPAGMDFDLDYEAEIGKHNRARTDLSDGFKKSGGRFPRSAGASPFASRSGSFAGSKFSLEAKYKSHLRSFRETHQLQSNTTEFVSFYGDFVPAKTNKRRAFPYSDIELLNSVEFSEVIPNSKIIVRTSESIKVLVTPFALKAVQQFVQLSLEIDKTFGSSLFDALQVYYTSLIVRPLISNTQYSTLIVSAPDIHIQSIQDMRFPEAALNGGNPFDDIKKRYGYSDSSLCSVDIQIQNFLQISNAGTKTVSTSFNSQRFMDAHYSLDIDVFKLVVRFLGSVTSDNGQKIDGIPSSKRLVPEVPELPWSSPVVMEVFCTDIKWLCDFENSPNLTSPSTVAINMQSQTFNVIFINETAEIMAGAAVIWTVFANDLYNIATKYMEQEQLRLQAYVETVIRESVKHSLVGDAKFLISPSSLWVLGTSFRKFQVDLGWRLLAHIRHCAKSLGANRMNLKTAATLKNTHISEILPTLTKWFGMRDDRSDPTKNHILGLIFDARPKDAEAIASDIIKSISGYTTSIAFVIQNVKISSFAPGGGENIFQISPLLIQIDTIKRNKMDILEKKSSRSSLTTKDLASSHFVDISLFLSASKSSVSFNPNVFRLIRHIIRVYNRVTRLSLLSSSKKDSAGSLKSVVSDNMDFSLIMSTAIDEVMLSATANNLSMKSVARSMSINLSYFSKSTAFNLPSDLQFSGTGTVTKVMVDVLELSPHGTNSLLSLQTNGIMTNLSGNSTALASFDLIELRLPKSLLKLQAFFEQWGDTLPEYDLLFNRLMKELEMTSGPSLPKQSSHRTISMALKTNVQIIVKSFVLVSDLLSTLRCKYSISNIVGFIQKRTAADINDMDYSARIESHRVEFETRNHHQTNSTSLYTLPEVAFEGSFASSDDASNLKALLHIGILEGSFDVHLIDQLLTLQSLLGSEINDIVEMVMFYYKRRLEMPQPSSVVPSKPFTYDLNIIVGGLQVAAAGPQSTLLLTADTFTIRTQNVDSETLRWTLSLQNSAFSLVANGRDLARIVIGVKLQNHSVEENKFELLSDIDPKERIEKFFLKISKLNGVLQPIGLPKLMEFMLFYSKELDERSRIKIAELEMMKQNAQRLLTSVNLPATTPSVEAKSFFLDKVVLVQVDNIGISVPLKDDFEGVGKHVPALLLGFRDIQYESYRLVENQGGIRDISVQFVNKFDSHNESDFLPDSHPVENRFLLKHIQGTVHQFFRESFGSVKINAGIHGFELNLNSSITHHLNALISIYEKERNVFNTATSTSSTGTSASKPQVQSFTEMVFDCDFVFGSGVCKINCKHVSDPKHKRGSSHTSGVVEENYDLQIFSIPGIGFKINGTTCFGDDSHLDRRVQRGIYITQHIFESENVLHPTVLAFFLDIASSINLDLLTSASKPVPSSAQKDPNATITSLEAQKHEMTYFLKLSQTKVSLSCLPESKVNLNFVLEEADVLACFVPNAQLQPLNAINLTCSIKGMNGSLRHSFSPEDCFRWSVSHLLLNSSFLFSHDTRNYLFKLDSASISAALNVRQLQDLLLFQRLWITPLVPTKAAQTKDTIDQPSVFASLLRLPGYSDQEKPFKDSFHFVLRLPSVSLSSDFGQSVGKTSLVVSNWVSVADVGWTNKSFGTKNLSSSVVSIRCLSEGRYSGEANVVNPQLMVLGTNNYDPSNNEIITVGILNVERLDVQLQFQYERILIVDAQPLDYLMIQRWISNEGVLTLCSDLSVVIDSFKAIVSRRTIPALLQLVERIKTAMEEKINLDLSLSPPTSPKLRRSSKVASRVTLTSNSQILPHSDAMVRNILWYKTGLNCLGRVKVQVNHVLLNFMRYNFRDPDCARIISKAVAISLDHQCQSENILRESIKVTMDGVSVKKSTTRSLTPEEERMWSALEWFTFLGSSSSKNVATVPAIAISLEALSYLAEKRVELGGETTFASQIDIALNFGLYKFLQELVEFYDSAFKQSGDGGMLLTPTKVELLEVENIEQAVDFLAFEYKNGDFKFDPQLKVTGEATPRELIEWLGVNKTRIPELLYTKVGIQLSNLIVWVARNA
ncbi:hypothetical protein BCR33DRAFT_712841 [Rhizoclosmatium globosum]|uniref:Csf1 N-terminal domain-containing protein n=1 Tax=Rhizoclosmatium globosum TaxID=329046 RepID=A0A1Y2CV08_9FUNG|nr:hypothetical protein BCR33DRAFT_712841 [Rhizoclosmatium globosum]|eukprot:ORY50868.1 hypothetical protein BCR33DRAFT_712841 [Rhizoclosmatium globosum]